jgi:tetratricopeptide (TPR) repeat protein
MSMRIRRDRSALHYGVRSRRRRPLRKLIFWLVVLLLGSTAMWQLTPVESEVSTLINGQSTPTQDAVTLAQEAEAAYMRGDLEMSVDFYRTASQLEPENIGVLFEFVRNLIYGSYVNTTFDDLTKEALEVAFRMVELDSNSPLSNAAYALALTENDRNDEAAAAATRAIELDADWAEGYAYLALAYLGQQRWEDALNTAKQAADLNPNSVDAQRIYALALASTGQYDRAINQYENAIRVHPRLDALYFELAQFYVFQDNFDAAIQSYDRILSNDPRNVKAWTRKCQAYFRQRDDANAREACQQAIELDASFPEAYMQLGIVNYYSRDYPGAIQALNQCVQLMNAQGWPMPDQLSECYYVQGLAHYLNSDNCAVAMPLFEQAFLTDLTALGRETTLDGMERCTGQQFNADDFITPIPDAEASSTPEGIDIY